MASVPHSSTPITWIARKPTPRRASLVLSFYRFHLSAIRVSYAPLRFIWLACHSGRRVLQVFGDETSQERLYAQAVRPIVSQVSGGARTGRDKPHDIDLWNLQVLKGYNGTVLAYGQTGSGKTHTIQGGCIPMCIGCARRVGKNSIFLNAICAVHQPLPATFPTYVFVTCTLVRESLRVALKITLQHAQ